MPKKHRQDRILKDPRPDNYKIELKEREKVMNKLDFTLNAYQGPGVLYQRSVVHQPPDGGPVVAVHHARDQDV